MEKLINYIENHLKWAKQTPESAKIFFSQAFGAVQFYIIEHNLYDEEFTALETKWNTTYKPAFEAIMYGSAENA